MNPIVRRLVSKSMEQLAGHGVGLDRDDRLCFPDGLDPDRAHRFIDLVMAEEHDSPRAALHHLFGRVGVPEDAVRALGQILTEEGRIDFRFLARHPVELASAIPSLREVPEAFRRFLIDGLSLADEDDATLDDAVVSARLRAAEAIGCEPDWDAILREEDAVRALSRDWREGRRPARR